LQVAVQRSAADHGQRQRQVAAQHIPSLCRDGRTAQRRRRMRIALGTGAADPRIVQVFVIHVRTVAPAIGGEVLPDGLD